MTPVRACVWPLTRLIRWLTPAECRRLGAQLALWELLLLIVSALR
jgi:hypothetical protein